MFHHVSICCLVMMWYYVVLSFHWLIIMFPSLSTLVIVPLTVPINDSFRHFGHICKLRSQRNIVVSFVLIPQIKKMRRRPQHWRLLPMHHRLYGVSILMVSLSSLASPQLRWCSFWKEEGRWWFVSGFWVGTLHLQCSVDLMPQWRSGWRAFYTRHVET